MTDSDDFTRSDLALSLQQVTKIDSKESGRGAQGEVNYQSKVWPYLFEKLLLGPDWPNFAQESILKKKKNHVFLCC